jgi:hypothetical protein
MMQLSYHDKILQQNIPSLSIALTSQNIEISYLKNRGAMHKKNCPVKSSSIN